MTGWKEGISEGFHRNRVEEGLDLFWRISVTRNTWKEKANIGSLKAPRGFSVGLT